MVFGLFKKKVSKPASFRDAASSALAIQLALTDADTKRLLSDKFALGYMFGFHDGLLQAMEMGNRADAFTAMAASYECLFADSPDGPVILEQSLHLQDDATFKKGMVAGGTELFEYLKEKKPPMGLATHLQGSEG